MRIAKIDHYDLLNSPGTDTACCSIWFSGCTIRCPSCHNRKLWDGTQGMHVAPKDIIMEVDKTYGTGVRVVALLGGEPLDQNMEQLRMTCIGIKNHHPDMAIWLYTGYNIDDIPSRLLDYIDVVKTGRYSESQKADKWLGFLSSSNQKLYKRRNNAWMEVEHYAD